MIDLNTITHHPVIEDITDVLCNRTQNQDKGFFRVEAAYFLGKIAASMRVKVNTKDKGQIPVNVYAMALATSGFGKGHSVNIVESQFLSGFKKRFMEDTFPIVSEQHLFKVAIERAVVSGKDEEDEKAKLDKEFMKLGAYPFTFDSATSAAVKQIREKLLLADIGAINFQMDEIGSNLLANADVMAVFLELFDQGIVNVKLIKNTNDNIRAQDMDGKTPANMLLFGTPSSLFDGSKTEDAFYDFLLAGMARRCFFGWGEHERAYAQLTPAEIYQRKINPKNISTISKWASHFTVLADATKYGWEVDLNDKEAIELLTYQMECEKLADAMSTNDEMRKAEMSHRYFKVLKLAGAFAFIEESSEITMDNLYHAIKLVEESGDHFNRILNREKPYVKLAKYIAEAGIELTHADLHEALPFYKMTKSHRTELMEYAKAWASKNHIIIRTINNDGIEFFNGEMLKETDLDEISISYSDHFAYNFINEKIPFDQIHVVTQAEGYNWCNHAFKSLHRQNENFIPGFNMIALDIDGGIPLSTVHEIMSEYVFMTYTTKRHTDDENRFRLILPINYNLNLDIEDYREFMHNIREWVPFETDDASEQVAKKWTSHHLGKYHYNLEGEVMDALQFIPKTSKNELYQKGLTKLEDLDNIERWFAQKIVVGNRNKQLFNFAAMLADTGMNYPAIEEKVISFNSRLPNGIKEEELRNTILRSIAKKVS